MKLLFLDESGDHNLAKIDPQYPVFVLGGIIIEQAYAEGVIQPELDSFKRDLFGTENLILHTSDLTRNRAGFERLKDRDFRAEFYARLNALMAAWEYEVVACVVRKDEHLARYGAAALDPYLLSLDVLVERFALEIGNVRWGGTIVVESRGYPLDAQLELAWLNLKIQGTERLRAVEVTERIRGLSIRDKRENIAGLQLADLVVTPIGRHVLGKRSHEDFRIIESKFRRSRGEYQDEGLIILPK
jgi:hypothetical protein